MGSNQYHLFGCVIRSDWVLPCRDALEDVPPEIELIHAPALMANVVARHLGQLDAPTNWFVCKLLPDGSRYLKWKGLFEFLVSPDGRRIWGNPLEQATLESFQNYLLNQVVSFAFVQQGAEPLHATTVAVGSKAIAFIGDSGFGKSTLGAAFLREGHRVLSDDLLIAKSREGGYDAVPGLPRIKLRPEVAEAILGARLGATPLSASDSKLLIPLSSTEWCSDELPLTAIYALRSRDDLLGISKVSVETLAPRMAFKELVTNTFNCVVQDHERLVRLLRAAGAVAATVPVRALRFKRSLSSLNEVCDRVISESLKELT